MPPSRFNRTAWPETGPHRELLEFLDAVHRRFGCRSLREVGRAMHLSYSRVHDIVRGTSLPVSGDQVRSLVLALVGSRGEESETIAAQAAELFVTARRARDEGTTVVVLPEPVVEGGAPPGRLGQKPGSRATRTSQEATDPGLPELVVTARADDRPAGGRARSRRLLVVTGLAAVAVVAVLSTTSSSAEQRTGGIVLQDSFGGPELDPQRWAPATRADLIRPRGGALHFVIGPTDSADGAEARLEPRSLVAALVCSRAECNQYDDFDPPGSYVLMRPGNGSTDQGEQIPVRIVQVADGTVQFFVRGQLVAQGPPGDALLQTFSWDLYGAKSEAWDLTVNSLIVSD